MAKPLTKEQIVANELWLYLFDEDLSNWMDDDQLRLMLYMIVTVKVARDISAEEVVKAMNATWSKDWPTLPTFNEL